MIRNSHLTQAVHEFGNNAEVHKVGRFRFLSWPNDEARLAAASLLTRTPQDQRDEHFWDKYYSFCDDVAETPNVGVTAGLGGLLCLGTGCTTTVLPFNAANAFLGVGNGVTWGTISTTLTPNGVANTMYISSTITATNTSKNTLSVGDVLLLTSQTTSPTSTSPWPSAATNPEYVTVAAISGPASSQYTITLAAPPLYARSSGTTWIYSGSSTATGLSASSSSGMAFKGISSASTFPAYSTPSGVPTVIWQCDFGTADAQFQWLEACIGSSSAPPSNSPSSAAATTQPTGTLLAKATWYPSPIVKGTTLASAQYILSLS